MINYNNKMSDIIKILFNKGFCLTADENYSPFAKIDNYHYFSDGTLICKPDISYYNFLKIKNSIEKYGYIIKNKILADNNDIFKTISEYTKEKYLNIFLYIDKLIDNNYCLSVTGILTGNIFNYYSPDKQNFALFADGTLIIDENYNEKEKLVKELFLVYPQIKHIEFKPNFYIHFIYKKLTKHQKTALSIYNEIISEFKNHYNIEDDKPQNEQEARYAIHKLFLMVLADYDKNYFSILKNIYSKIIHEEIIKHLSPHKIYKIT